MSHELLYNPQEALRMMRAYSAAAAELEAAGDTFDPEALATAILMLEDAKSATDAANLARKAAAVMRAEMKRST